MVAMTNSLGWVGVTVLDHVLSDVLAYTVHSIDR